MIFEAADGFYETKAGRRILNLAQTAEVYKNCQWDCRHEPDRSSDALL